MTEDQERFDDAIVDIGIHEFDTVDQAREFFKENVLIQTVESDFEDEFDGWLDNRLTPVIIKELED
jgi:hypothetical protein